MLKLPKIDAKDVCFKYHKEFKRLPSGICCVFVPLNAKWGIKTYPYKSTANKALRIQKRAYRLGLGPKCGRLLKFYSDGNPIWGFVTRRATLVNITVDYDSLRDQFVSNSKQYTELFDMLKKNRFPVWDLHTGNIGTIDGKLVCIDFVAD